MFLQLAVGPAFFYLLSIAVESNLLNSLTADIPQGLVQSLNGLVGLIVVYCSISRFMKCLRRRSDSQAR